MYTGLDQASTSATCAMERLLCWMPVATHSTSMLNTGWLGGMLMIIGGYGAMGRFSGLAGEAAEGSFVGVDASDEVSTVMPLFTAGFGFGAREGSWL